MDSLLLKSIADSVQELTEDEQVIFEFGKSLNYPTKDKLNDVLRRNRKLNESENGRLERLSRTLSSKSSKRSRSVNFTADLDKCCVDRVQGSKFEFFSC